ncbi:hypothetical protein M5E87_09730 [Flavonifractor plautii]|nr:hypothetical protein M5E87_09730 [Flavonifractor plautii]
MAGCFDAAYIGEFYYKLGPAYAPVQLKLMYDAGMSATYTASIYTWKAVANTMVYTGYAVAALAYELFWRREGLGPAVAGAGALIALYVFLCGLALFTAVRPEPIQRLIRRILTFLARHWKVMARRAWWTRAWKRWTSSAHSSAPSRATAGCWRACSRACLWSSRPCLPFPSSSTGGWG